MTGIIPILSIPPTEKWLQEREPRRWALTWAAEWIRIIYRHGRAHVPREPHHRVTQRREESPSDGFINRAARLRTKARANKNYVVADLIRAELASRGIALEDLSSGRTRWRS